MTVRGVLAFLGYIIHIYARWTRVTYARFGVRGVLDSSYRPRRAGTGRGVRHNPFGRAHGDWAAVASSVVIRRLQLERAVAA